MASEGGNMEQGPNGSQETQEEATHAPESLNLLWCHLEIQKRVHVLDVCVSVVG